MSEPLICPFKKNVGLGQCRAYVRDPAKQPDVRNGVEWHNCVSCARIKKTIDNNLTKSEGKH